jgi:hypothetical protein
MSWLLYAVRALQLVCAGVCVSQLYRGERAALAGPVLFAVCLQLQYPSPGKGVGQPAGALPGLQLLHPNGATSQKAVGLGKGGGLLGGHGYVVLFWRSNKACHKALPTLERMCRRCAPVTKLHFVLVSRDSKADLQALVKKQPFNTLTLPVAHDASEQANANYMGAFGCITVPHAFVVGPDGVIIWHGNYARRALAHSVAALAKTLAPPDVAAAVSKDEKKKQ